MGEVHGYLMTCLTLLIYAEDWSLPGVMIKPKRLWMVSD